MPPMATTAATPAVTGSSAEVPVLDALAEASFAVSAPPPAGPEMAWTTGAGTGPAGGIARRKRAGRGA